NRCNRSFRWVTLAAEVAAEAQGPDIWERSAKGWKQETLAKKTGYKLSVIQKLEQGTYFSVPCLERCAEVLDVQVADLLEPSPRPGAGISSTPEPGRASAHYGVTPANTCSRNSSLQPHARRFMATLSLPGCCLSSDRLKRFSQAKFSRVTGSRIRDS